MPTIPELPYWDITGNYGSKRDLQYRAWVDSLLDDMSRYKALANTQVAYALNNYEIEITPVIEKHVLPYIQGF